MSSFEILFLYYQSNRTFILHKLHCNHSQLLRNAVELDVVGNIVDVVGLEDDRDDTLMQSAGPNVGSTQTGALQRSEDGMNWIF